MAAAYLPANLTLAKGWSTACYTLLTGAANLSSGLVDGSGRPVSSYGNETWGIDYATCQQHCNATVIPLVRQDKSCHSVGQAAKTKKGV